MLQQEEQEPIELPPGTKIIPIIFPWGLDKQKETGEVKRQYVKITKVLPPMAPWQRKEK